MSYLFPGEYAKEENWARETGSWMIVIEEYLLFQSLTGSGVDLIQTDSQEALHDRVGREGLSCEFGGGALTGVERGRAMAQPRANSLLNQLQLCISHLSCRSMSWKTAGMANS